ncbi:hypothetical protein NQ317_019176 [Molorchus minor]|uniref:C2H2-type domain-containing protein n=1 Tax=Molorchus minor TaxID=1323400 RepID=A0ABQ9J5K9_9CUCU|nr:hypothetical protein NQ317_019176 [Molorchus minor]
MKNNIALEIFLMMAFVRRLPVLLDMEESGRTLCRLCFGRCADCSPRLEGFLNYKLKFIIPHLNLELTSNPMICKRCIDSISTHYQFKMVCMENNEPTHNFKELEFISKNRDLLSLLLRHEQNRRKCGLCHTKKNVFRQQEGPVDRLLKTMLQRCLPDLDSPISTVCANCMDSLENQFEFINNCLDAEEKINNYFYVKSLDRLNYKVNLQDVVNFISGNSNDKQSNESDVEEDVEGIVEFNEDDNEEPDVQGDTQPEEYIIEMFDEEPEKDEDLIGDDNVGRTKLFYEGQYNANNEGGKDVDMVGVCNDYGDDDADGTEETIDVCGIAGKSQLAMNDPGIYLVDVDGDPDELIEVGEPGSRELFHQPLEDAKTTDVYTKELIPYKPAPAGLNNPRKPTYSCQQCPFQFSSKKKLHTHMRNHSKKDPNKTKARKKIYKCSQCSYTTRKKIHLTGHEMLHEVRSEKTTFKCTRCQFETSHGKLFDNHMCSKDHTASEDECYEKSEMELKSEITLEEEFNELVKAELEAEIEDTYQVNMSELKEKEIILEEEFDRLVEEFDSSVENVKLECGKKLHIQENNQDVGFNSVDVENTTESEDCGVVHTEKQDNRYSSEYCKFLNAQIVPFPFHCSLCPFESKDEASLKTHMTAKHGLGYEGTIHNCDLCQYSSSNLELLSNHMTKRHRRYLKTQSKEIQCKLCPFTAVRMLDLITHMKSHRKDLGLEIQRYLQESTNSFRCLVCPQASMREDVIRKHLLSHISILNRAPNFSKTQVDDNSLNQGDTDIIVDGVTLAQDTVAT